MTDRRILAYRTAALAMKNGDFQVDFPLGPAHDDIAQLGAALKELGEAMERRLHDFEQLALVAEKVNAGLLLDEVLDYIYESFRALIPYDRIGVALLDDTGRIVRAHYARANYTPVLLKEGHDRSLEGSSLEGILSSGKPRIINDLQAHALARPESESTQLMLKEGIHASLTCPLISPNRPLGFVFFSSLQTGVYDQAHVRDFELIARQLAVTIEKSLLYQQLVDLNALKNKFLGMAAHDLRNPLGTLHGLLTLFSRGDLGEVTESQQEMVRVMERSCTNMLMLVNELLDVNAIESGQLVLKRQPRPMDSFIRECCMTSRYMARAKAIDLVMTLPAELPEVALDPARLKQVFDNLIANAVKYSYSGTRITVSARVEGDEVVVSVADEGQGIRQEELPNIFREFGRTSAQPTGGESSTGLGLAIVKRIVEAHEGRIWVESELGTGSVFSFSLPLKASSAAPSPKPGWP